MNFNEYFNLGVISKVFSFKGEIIARIDVNVPTLYTNLKVLFVEQKESLIPFFIEKIEEQRNGFVKIKFKGVNTQEAAKLIVRCNIYLPDELLPKLEGDEFYFHEITGYKIINQDNEEIGTINQVYDLPANPMIETIIDGKEILIPMNLMEKIDKKEETIFVVIPDGLFEVFD